MPRLTPASDSAWSRSSDSTRRSTTTPALPRRADPVRGLARIVRLPNGVIAGLGVFAGAWWSAGWLRRSVVFAALAAGALTAVANIANDLADVEIDRGAHPDRPLPAGDIDVAHARVMLWAAVVAALAFAFSAEPALGWISVAVVALMLAYNHGLKRAGLPGNIVVAVLASLPFLYGAWAIDELRAGLMLAAVAAPLHFAREVAKDLDDAAADVGHRRTVPIVYGPAAARWTCGVAAAIFCVAAAVLARHDLRLGIAFVPALLCVAAGIGRLAQRRPGTPRMFKVAMVLATLALIAFPR